MDEEKNYTWAFDPEKLKWKDLKFIDSWDGNITGKIARIGEMLSRLVVDHSEQDIDELTLEEIRQVFQELQKFSEEAALPKETESASPTS